MATVKALKSVVPHSEPQEEPQGHHTPDGDLGQTSGADTTVTLPTSVWISIPKGDEQALADFCALADLDVQAYETLSGIFKGIDIKSPTIELLDVTQSDTLQENLDILTGQITVAVSSQNGGTSNSGARRQTTPTQGQLFRGFVLDETRPQHVVLARFKTRTRLEEPDPVTGITFGVNTVVHVCLPVITGEAPKAANGRTLIVGGQPATYRPSFRLMVEHQFDNPKRPINAWFVGRPRGASAEFGLQMPQYVYAAALESGATKDELCVREVSSMDRRGEKLIESNTFATGEAPDPISRPMRGSALYE